MYLSYAYNVSNTLLHSSSIINYLIFTKLINLKIFGYYLTSKQTKAQRCKLISPKLHY